MFSLKAARISGSLFFVIPFLGTKVDVILSHII